MGKFIDLTGKKFGRLKVINKTEIPFNVINKKHVYWMCECDCGKEHYVSSSNLLSGEVKSCGCLKKDISRKEYGESSLNSLFDKYKRKAKEKKLDFKLSKEEFVKLTKDNCFYCGRKPFSITKGKRNYGEYIYNGIDRIDSNKGYIIENCVSCCGQCNKAKLIEKKEDFYNWVKLVYNNLNDKGLL